VRGWTRRYDHWVTNGRRWWKQTEERGKRSREEAGVLAW
jgi:hypothetical protein